MLMAILLWVLILIFSIFLLVKSADYFADSLELIALALGAPMFIIGVTLASVATSIPELATGIAAILSHAPTAQDIISSNVIGSNIANIALVVGLTAALLKIKVDWDVVKVDLPLFVGSAVFLGLAMLDKVFSRPEAILAVLGYILFLKYSLDTHKNHKVKNLPKTKIKAKYIIILILSLIGVFIGAKYCVESVVNLAHALGISSAIIAVTAIALGTSLPELSVSISAALKGNHELSLGNITGSNIFNIFMVMGVPGLIKSFSIPQSMIVFGYPFMIALSILFVVMAMDRELTRYEGFMLVLLYALFIVGIYSYV